MVICPISLANAVVLIKAINSVDSDEPVPTGTLDFVLGQFDKEESDNDASICSIYVTITEVKTPVLLPVKVHIYLWLLIFRIIETNKMFN